MVDKRVFSKVLVANRGEIAVRIMRSAQELGLKVVAIYEETDKDAFHIMRADEAVCIGSGPRKDYLNIDKIILAAQQTGAQLDAQQGAGKLDLVPLADSLGVFKNLHLRFVASDADHFTLELLAFEVHQGDFVLHQLAVKGNFDQVAGDADHRSL